MLVPQTECWKVALYYQAKSYFTRGQNISIWLCGTKPNRVYAVNEMLEVGFVILSQIVFVPRRES